MKYAYPIFLFGVSLALLYLIGPMLIILFKITNDFWIGAINWQLPS